VLQLRLSQFRVRSKQKQKKDILFFPKLFFRAFFLLPPSLLIASLFLPCFFAMIDKPFQGGRYSHSIQHPSRFHIIVLQLAISSLSLKYRYRLYSLLTEAVSWGIICGFCLVWSGSQNVKTRSTRSAAQLAICILGAALCENAGEGTGGWPKVGVCVCMQYDTRSCG
jgi:hypothetical protein